ncbi:MAG: transporter [Aestuariibacter sp.]
MYYNNRKCWLTATLLLGVCQVSADVNFDLSLTPHSHAPIGVMGDHLHKDGEFMVSYRFMDMAMAGNLQGDNSISNDDIVTTVANPYANPPMSPPTVRVVPQEMSMKMHMVGMMYAPTDNITLMAMLNYVSNDMQLLTYQGGMGTEPLGEFITESSGLADSKLSALIGIADDGTHKWHANIGLTLPTGATDEKQEVLTPMGMRMEMRLPYSMQLGGGSYRLSAGLTYTGRYDDVSWGAQFVYDTAMDDADEGYQWGAQSSVTAWLAKQVSGQASLSLRTVYTSSDELSGSDDVIVAPVTTANPANYGKDLWEIALGTNLVFAGKHRIAVEYLIPIQQDVNGVQMELDKTLVMGYQISF